MEKSKEQAEFDNLQALMDFKNDWAANRFTLSARGPGLHFHAQIVYISPARSVSDQTDVRAYLTGYRETGMIKIDDTRRMTSDNYHLQIDRAFGEYRFDQSSGELIITNTSGKMGGKYTIQILPIGAPKRP